MLFRSGYWFLYLRTGYDNALVPRIVAFLPEVLGCSLMEYLIFACNFETFDTFKAVVGSVGASPSWSVRASVLLMTLSLSLAVMLISPLATWKRNGDVEGVVHGIGHGKGLYECSGSQTAHNDGYGKKDG